MKKLSNSQKTAALLIAAAGVIFYSAKAVFVKMAYVYGIDPITLMLYRMALSMPFYLIVWLFHRSKNDEKVALSVKEIVLITFLGLIGYYASSLFDFTGLQYIDASLERLILFIYPTIVIVLSRVFLKVNVVKEQVIAIVLTYIGVFVIFSQDILDGTQSDNLLLGAILIFMCAITYATYLVGSNRMLPKLGTVNFTTYVMFVSFLATLIHYFIEVGFSFEMYPFEVYVISILMAFVSTVLPSYMIGEAIKRVGANVVGIVGSLGPVSTISLSMIFLGESLTLIQFGGAFIILAGIFIIGRVKK